MLLGDELEEKETKNDLSVSLTIPRTIDKTSVLLLKKNLLKSWIASIMFYKFNTAFVFVRYKTDYFHFKKVWNTYLYSLKHKYCLKYILSCIFCIGPIHSFDGVFRLLLIVQAFLKNFPLWPFKWVCCDYWICCGYFKIWFCRKIN